MNTLVRAIKDIDNAVGNDKLSLLHIYENVPYLKDTLRFIYNPYCKTGISTAKASKIRLTARYETPVTIPQALEYFSIHQTGTDADIGFAAEFVNYCTANYGQDAGRLALAIVTQNLKIGVNATSLNKVYGKDFIPKTGCMLGTLYSDVPHIAWPCIITEKLDGVRRILIKEHGACRLYSRSGHEDTGLVEIIRDAAALPDGFVYDGELLAAGDFKDNIALRQATNSIAGSKNTRTGLVFNVFDMVPVDEFFAGKSTDTALIRKIRLAATLMDDNLSLIDKDWQRRIQAFGIHTQLTAIKPVPILGLATCLEDVTPIAEEIWRNGGEGVMLNTVSGLYEVKRSKALIKIKHTEEIVLPVVDFIEGTGKYEESLGAVVVQYKNSYVGVGSGFTDYERHYIWNHKDEFIGRPIEIETFGESINANGCVSLNCPIYKRFVGAEE